MENIKFGRNKKPKNYEIDKFGFPEVSSSGNESSSVVLKFSRVLGLKNQEEQRKSKVSV